MPRKAFCHAGKLLCSLVFASLLAPLSSVAQTRAPLTARAMLETAITTAKEWKADARLTSVSSLAVDSAGKGATWFYGFYSPSADSFLNVTAKGRVVDALQVGAGQRDALPADFLDSDHVMEQALAAGLKGSEPRMGLTRGGWVVSGGTQKGDPRLWLNARTGRLIKREVVE
jgi:hypothetical protein